MTIVDEIDAKLILLEHLQPAVAEQCRASNDNYAYGRGTGHTTTWKPTSHGAVIPC